jgi:hypothetical protein
VAFGFLILHLKVEVIDDLQDGKRNPWIKPRGIDALLLKAI